MVTDAAVLTAPVAPPAGGAASQARAGARTSRARRLGAAWLGGWPRIAHLVGDALFAPFYLLVVTATVSTLLFAFSVVGLPLLFLSLAVGMLVVAVERWRLALLGRRWVPRWAGRPAHLPAWRRVVLDSRPWRAQLYLLALGLWGLTGGLATFLLLAGGLTALALPFLPAEAVSVSGEPLAAGWRWLLAAVGLNVLLVLPLLARGLVLVDTALARLLVSTGEAEQVEQLERRVDTLTQSRQAAVDSVDAERRRIERDLHDGPQQRLVAVAMDLGLARQRLAEDPEAAAVLLARAHDGAKEAITEMRRVARGIHPPVLTDRGLDAALSALAARSPVPVSVRVDLPRRPPARLEAIAYFSVSEALTNVAKHSRARTASVRVEERATGAGPGGAALVATVSDDGVGGADPTRGSGLVGLRDRVAAVDGRVLVSSPAGGPTVVTVELPLPAAETSTTGAGAPPAAVATAPSTTAATAQAVAPAVAPATAPAAAPLTGPSQPTQEPR